MAVTLHWRLRDLISVAIGANDPVAAVDDAVKMDECGRPTWHR